MTMRECKSPKGVGRMLGEKCIASFHANQLHRDRPQQKCMGGTCTCMFSYKKR